MYMGCSNASGGTCLNASGVSSYRVCYENGQNHCTIDNMRTLLDVCHFGKTAALRGEHISEKGSEHKFDHNIRFPIPQTCFSGEPVVKL